VIRSSGSIASTIDATATEMKAGRNAMTSVIAGKTLWRPPRPSPSTRFIVNTASVRIARAGRSRAPSSRR
jgi:hypothetical protein